MTTVVIAPVGGLVGALSGAPDPVFAAEMVGSGVAIEPLGGRMTALAPISGTLVKVHPHAYVIAGDSGAVLVHLGIDTVKLAGDGFEVLAEEKSVIEAGAPVVSWDPMDIASRGLSAMVLICVLDTVAGSVSSPTLGSQVSAGDALFDLP